MHRRVALGRHRFVPLAGYVNIFHGQALADLRSKIRGVVGLFGAIEIRNVNGPLLVGRSTTWAAKSVSLGQSPKTEYFWYEAWADDAAGSASPNSACSSGS